MTFETPYEADNLTVTFYGSESPPRLEFSGKLALANPTEIFYPLFESFHTELVQKGVKEVNADLKPFEFTNSSGMKIFIKWLTLIGKAPDAEKYKVTFLCNPAYKWQSGLKHMLIMAKGYAEVKEIG
jgi:hypothetical protein